MPRTKVVYFADDHGNSPLLMRFALWPDKLIDRCRIRIGRLASLGHELRRPEADLLRDGIHELRIKYWKGNYRILYFFHDQTAVLFDAITKEDKVPAKEIDRAITAKECFSKDS
jgi:phage-related protein